MLFFFNDTATTEIYTLSLHDALPISRRPTRRTPMDTSWKAGLEDVIRSEEHTSELQSQSNLVCRLLLEKKKLLPPRSSLTSPPSARAPRWIISSNLCFIPTSNSNMSF